MKMIIRPVVCAALALSSVACDSGLSAEDALGYKLAGDWHNVSSVTLPSVLSMSGEKKYRYRDTAGNVVSWGQARLTVLPGERFRIEYQPVEGRQVHADIGRFLSERVLELRVDSSGASSRTLAKRV